MRRVNLVPLAGAGQRFVDAGYVTPKPLIKINGVPMVVKAAKSLPNADRWIFICREEHIKNYGIDKELKYYFPNADIISLRYELIKEELDELKDAIDKKNIKEVADALTDILYVTYGAGHAFGIDLDKCFEEVQNSNMSKLGLDGKPIYNDKGKVMKGPNYFKPNLGKFLT